MNTDRPSRFTVLAALCLWLIVGALLFSRTMERDLNHDEHQFIVPGALLANEGLLPYRDYPLFHLPNLVFAYAGMDMLTGDPVFGPKLLTFLATWLTFGALIVSTLRNTQGRFFTRLGVATALCALLLFDPNFLYTAGKTWNHELPTCLLLLAILFHVEASHRNSLAAIALSGLTCGLAVGTRLTFAPCLLSLVGTTFFLPVEPRRRWTMALAFTAAATVAMAPSLYFLATAPKTFLFGNLEFPRLRLLDPENTRIQKTMTLWRKVRYFAKEVMLPSWPVFIAFFAFAIPPLRRRLDGVASERPVHLVTLTALFLLIGCFLPSRYQYQHFFAFIPLLLLGIALAGPGNPHGTHYRNTGPWLLIALATISGFLTWRASGKDEPPYSLLGLRDRDRWFSTNARQIGDEIRAAVPTKGPILTLAPTWPIAGGLSIYPEFATGPFAWRSAPFLAAERRPAQHLIAPPDLENLLAKRPPAAILVGVEDEALETPLVTYAKSHNFRPVPLKKKRTLWLPSTPTPANPSPRTQR